MHTTIAKSIQELVYDFPILEQEVVWEITGRLAVMMNTLTCEGGWARVAAELQQASEPN